MAWIEGKPQRLRDRMEEARAALATRARCRFRIRHQRPDRPVGPTYDACPVIFGGLPRRLTKDFANDSGQVPLATRGQTAPQFNLMPSAGEGRFGY